jgi:structural maintenance of chromosome 1
LVHEIAVYEEKILSFQSRIEKIEDEVFRSFCSKRGLSSIREYEEQQLRRVKEANEKKIQFATVLSKLKNQLIFEGQRLNDIERKLEKIEVSVQKDAENLAELHQLQNSFSQERKEALEELKNQRKQLHERRENHELKNQKIKELKKEAALLLDSILSLQKSIANKVL